MKREVLFSVINDKVFNPQPEDNTEFYNYFEYQEPEENSDYFLYERVLDLFSQPVKVNPAGADVYIPELFGFGVEYVMQMDYTSFIEFEERITKIREASEEAANKAGMNQNELQKQINAMKKLNKELS